MMTTDDQLDATFAALSDPPRALLAKLVAREFTVNELAGLFPIALQPVSKQLQVAGRAGLVRRGRNAQYRPRRLEIASLDETASWIDEPRRVWGSDSTA